MKKIIVILVGVVSLAACAPIDRVSTLKNGSADQVYELSSMYRYGIHVPKDTVESTKLLEQAADRGSKGAQYTLAVELDKAGKYHDAVDMYKKAASDGINAHAMYRIAMIYKTGLLGTVDMKSAKPWFEKTAKKGWVDSMFEYASILLDEKKFKDAYVWFGVAEKGNYGVDATIQKEQASFNVDPLEVLKLDKKIRKNFRMYLQPYM